MCTACSDSNSCTQWTCTGNYFLDITLGTYGACTQCLDNCDLCSTSLTCDKCKLGYNKVAVTPDKCEEPTELTCALGDMVELPFADFVTEFTLRTTTNKALATDTDAAKLIFKQKEDEFNFYKATVANNIVDTYCLKHRTTVDV